jgi:hypothetical protein
MPTISIFFGVAIRMYFREHGPPHFHAIYGGEDATIEIDTLRVMEGRLNRRALNLAHRAELMENWNLARGHHSLKTISPLE